MNETVDKEILEDKRSISLSMLQSQMQSSDAHENQTSPRPRRMSALRRMNSKLSEIREKSLSEERRHSLK